MDNRYATMALVVIAFLIGLMPKVVVCGETKRINVYDKKWDYPPEG